MRFWVGWGLRSSSDTDSYLAGSQLERSMCGQKSTPPGGVEGWCSCDFRWCGFYNASVESDSQARTLTEAL